MVWVSKSSGTAANSASSSRRISPARRPVEFLETGAAAVCVVEIGVKADRGVIPPRLPDEPAQAFRHAGIPGAFQPFVKDALGGVHVVVAALLPAHQINDFGNAQGQRVHPADELQHLLAVEELGAVPVTVCIFRVRVQRGEGPLDAQKEFHGQSPVVLVPIGADNQPRAGAAPPPGGFDFGKPAAQAVDPVSLDPDQLAGFAVKDRIRGKGRFFPRNFFRGSVVPDAPEGAFGIRLRLQHRVQLVPAENQFQLHGIILSRRRP